MPAESVATPKKENLTYVFFRGDTVTLRHLEGVSLEMTVKEKIMEPKPYGTGKRLKSVVCYWMTEKKEYMEKEFPFLDLRVTKRAIEGMPLV